MKQRIFSMLLALCVLLALLPVQLTAAARSDTDIAYPVEGGNIYFNKSTGTITDCDDTVTSADIPVQIDGITVTTIGWDAFEKCTSLTSVIIPNSVTRIYSGAFAGCMSLTSMTIPDSVTDIGSGTFRDCTSLTNLTIGNSVTDIGYRAFASCENLTSVTIPNSVTTIDEYAFEHCTSLTSITIPNSVTSIGNSVFNGCTSLTSVTIPDSVENIEHSLFSSCTSLTSVTIPDSVTSIGDFAFFSCTSLVSVTIPNAVTSIGEYSFESCESLISVTMPDSVKSIGKGSFMRCKSLTGIWVDENNENYSSDAYGVLFDKSKTALIQAPAAGLSGEYVIPSTVTSISDWAFSDCTNLAKVTIPNSVTSIGDDVFYNCTNLNGIWVDENNENYSSDESGVLFNKSKTILIQAPGAITEYSLPNGVEIIDASAFEYTGLTSVTIPDSVTSIGAYAFADCESLTSVTLPDSVKRIESGAFYYCTRLTHVYFLGNAPEIGSSVFCYLGDYGYVEPIPGLTLYYIEGKEGWTTPTWNDYSTATWNGETDPSGKPDDPAPSDGFSDVKGNEWFAQAVNYAVSNGLMNGMGNNKFEPNTGMTRAMLVTVLWRYAGEPLEGENTFTDLTQDWYIPAVTWAAHNGIVGGVGNGKFDPDGNVTREQLATILYRYCNSIGIDTSARADLSTFPDAGKVSAYAEDAMSWAVSVGLVTGTQEGSKTYLDPLGNATRAQVATILMRYIENVLK